jgi:ATP-binding protein involved in chromosome partitioning
MNSENKFFTHIKKYCKINEYQSFVNILSLILTIKPKFEIILLHLPIKTNRMNWHPDLILEALRTVRYPGTGKSIVEQSMVANDVRIDGRRVSFSIVFERENDPFAKSVVKAAEAAVLAYVSPDVDIRGNISTRTKQAPRPEPEKGLPGVRNIVAVASGKGGVGKSTVAVNLAVALAKEGFRVGLLDADIYGPSVPKMFGTENARPYTESVQGRERIVPVEKYGVRMLSIGFL